MSNGFFDQRGGWVEQGPPPESARGYREQAAWLEREGLSVLSAEHTLSQRCASLDPNAYNEGGHQATIDYITRLRCQLAS